MSPLPCIPSRECVKAPEKVGFYFLLQKVSPISLCHQDPFAQIVVPYHRQLDQETLQSIILEAELRINHFINFL